MDINIIENLAIDWQTIPQQASNGTTGFVIAQTLELPTFKIRLLQFSANYEADHWCDKGHIIHVLKGDLIIAYNDDSTSTITQGNSLILGDNIKAHKTKTMEPTQILIID